MAENLQEYYKRMAEAIDTQLEQKGKAALFYPVGSGSGRIVWAWINAHPDAAVIWVVPGETRRGMRLEEAKRIGQEIPPRVQLIHCEDNTPQRCLELAKIRPACIILDGSREFTAFPCGERVRWLQRFSPQAKLLGLIDTDQPVSCCLAEAMFQGGGHVLHFADGSAGPGPCHAACRGYRAPLARRDGAGRIPHPDEAVERRGRPGRGRKSFHQSSPRGGKMRPGAAPAAGGSAQGQAAGPV